MTMAAAGSPQAFPLELAGEARIGWVIASHDATRVSVSWVLNPGYTLASGSLCAQMSAFDWADPATCQRFVDLEAEGTPTVIASFDSMGGAKCGDAVYLQVHASVIDETSGAPMGSAYAGTFKGRIAIVTECAMETELDGCTRSASDWLKESEFPLETVEIAGLAYSEYDMREILAMPAQSDASVLVARARLAARLNLAAGAEIAGDADDAYDDAADWLDAHGGGSRVPFGIKVADEGLANPDGWDDGVNTAAVLDRFSEGFAGSPRCAL